MKKFNQWHYKNFSFYQDFTRTEFKIGVDWDEKPFLFFIGFLFWSFEIKK